MKTLVGLATLVALLATVSLFSFPGALGMRTDGHALPVSIRTTVTPLTTATAPADSRADLVLRSNGVPLADVVIEVRAGLSAAPNWARTDENELFAPPELLTRRTDADGAIRLDVPAGWLAFRVPGVSLAGRRTAEIPAGSAVTIDLAVPTAVSTEVRVVWEDGEPVPDARIVGRTSQDLWSLDSRELGRTDEDGYWRAPFIASRVLVRAVARSGAFSPTVQVDSTTTELTLSKRSGSVEGVVTDASGRPLADLPVAFVPQREMQDEDAIDRWPFFVRTDDDGHYACDNVPIGGLSVIACLAGDHSALVRRRLAVSVGGRHAVDLQFGADAGRALVRVLDAEGPTADQPFSVVYFGRDLPILVASLATTRGRTGPDGTAVVSGLIEGPYQLQLPKSPLAVKRDFVARQDREVEVTATLSATSRIELSLRDAEHNALVGWKIELGPAADGSLQSGTTDRQGAIAFADVAHTAQDVRVFAPGGVRPIAERTIVVDGAMREEIVIDN